jgi:hypothetical protein
VVVVLLVEETDEPKKTTDLLQVTDKLIMSVMQNLSSMSVMQNLSSKQFSPFL